MFSIFSLASSGLLLWRASRRTLLLGFGVSQWPPTTVMKFSSLDLDTMYSRIIS
uniref:Uncharacterized protein n=1 Tax=Arundo donax TaxID=35708 RepID=A0A0A9B0H4_ARUDO